VIFATRLTLGAFSHSLLDETELKKFLDVVVECARAHLVLATGLTSDLKHDAVAVEVSAGEREQDVEGGGGKREMLLGIGIHIRETIYRIPNMDVKRTGDGKQMRGFFVSRGGTENDRFDRTAAAGQEWCAIPP